MDQVIAENIQYQDYQIQNGVAGSIKRGTTGYHPSALERFTKASNKPSTSTYEEMKKYGIKPFSSLYVKDVDVKPTEKNSDNQKRNYYDHVAYSQPRPRVPSNQSPLYPIPGRSVNGVDRKEEQKLNRTALNIYTKELTHDTQKLRPSVEPQLLNRSRR